MLPPLQFDVFYALWGGVPWGGTPTAARLVLAGKEREAEGEESFPSVNVVCLNKNGGNVKTEYELHRTAGINAVDLGQG